MTEPLPPRSANPRRQVYVEPDARTTRTTALTIAARIHTGRGTSPWRLVQDAEVIADYLRTGQIPEPSGILTNPATLPTYDEIPLGQGWKWLRERPEGEAGIVAATGSGQKHRWWQRLDPVATIGLTAAAIGLTAGLVFICYLVTVTR